MRIISWNVNSVRARLRALRHVLRRYAPDVVCLQETKVSDDLSPQERFDELGYLFLVEPSEQKTGNAPTRDGASTTHG